LGLDHQDEGTILSVLGRNNDTSLIAGITSENATSYAMSVSAFPSLLAAYPNDPALGAPFNTGRGVLSTGTQDKRVSFFLSS
jgi:acetylcholinesterase